MIYTTEEYAAVFTFGGKHLSKESIRRRCRHGQLPAGHILHRKKKYWIIEVQKFPEALMKQYDIQLKLKAQPNFLP